MWLGYGYDREDFSSRDILKKKFLSSHCGSLPHDLLSGFHILLSSSRQNVRFSYTSQCHLPNTLHLIIKWRVCLFAKLTWRFKNNVQDHKGRREVAKFDFLSSDAVKSNDHSRRCALLRFLHGYMVSLLNDLMYFSYLFGYSYSNFKIKTKVYSPSPGGLPVF